ncbi:hypothetical protein AB0J72_50970 [Dactylosporangium sp. NPDC049742]|uniref:hypothetical protein n=1 Tax=Dactylosporangium sp. NPDC049742 TaxID=3154737 RepID=UPI003445F671
MKDERLADHVRQAMALDATHTEALGDSRARQALLERVINSPSAAPRPRRRWALTIGAAVTTATAAVLALAIALNGLPQKPTGPESTPGPGSPSGARRGDVFAGTSVSQSCVESYSAQSLARRSFAFDGTVAGIGATNDGTGMFLPVTFKVHRWFRGGSAGSVTVGLVNPTGGVSPDLVPFGIGSRLLVSGEPRFGGTPLTDPVAWACGFTRWHDAADAELWQQSFA